MAKESDLLFQESEQLPLSPSELQKQTSITEPPRRSELGRPSKTSAGSPAKHLGSGKESELSHHQKPATQGFHALEELAPSLDGLHTTDGPGVAGSKDISMEDLDKKLQEIIEKSYHNSMLTLENFEKMKIDFKMMRNEICEEQRYIENQFRQEVRESLAHQLSFVEEQNTEQKREHGGFLARLSHQDVKIE
jgi:hypothetical protein